MVVDRLGRLHAITSVEVPWHVGRLRTKVENQSVVVNDLAQYANGAARRHVQVRLVSAGSGMVWYGCPKVPTG